jgi:hypothetical protein
MQLSGHEGTLQFEDAGGCVVDPCAQFLIFVPFRKKQFFNALFFVFVGFICYFFL